MTFSKSVGTNTPGQVFLVGGAVRDEILEIPVKERDWVVVGSTAEEMRSCGFQQVGKDFPVFLHPDSKEEYALARQERKTGRGYTEFETETENVSLEEDLGRRDLTINAVAMLVDSNELIDPYGGLEDLKNRVLRHVSDAFVEDPVRVLRIARFMAQLSEHGFTIATETLSLLETMCRSGELSSLTPERVWKETEKALSSCHPRSYFEVLRRVGALKIIFPEVDCLFGIPQRPEFHPEVDTGLHTMLSLDRISELSKDPILRFATLVHDLGKGTTPKELLPSHKDHEQRSAQLASALCERLRIPKAYKRLALVVADYHLICHRSMRLDPENLEELLDRLGAWKSGSMVFAFSLCCMADARGRTGLESRPYPQVEFLEKCVSAAESVSAKALMERGFSGKELGIRIKRQRAASLIKVIQEHAKIDELKYARVRR